MVSKFDSLIGSQERKGEKIILGFSGGLDTSFCVKYLTDEQGYEVHSIIVNTGGFTEEELKDMVLNIVELKLLDMLKNNSKYSDYIDRLVNKKIDPYRAAEELSAILLR